MNKTELKPCPRCGATGNMPCTVPGRPRQLEAIDHFERMCPACGNDNVTAELAYLNPDEGDEFVATSLCGLCGHEWIKWEPVAR